MQRIRNGLIIHLENSLKIIFVKANFTPKIKINLKKLPTSLGENDLFIRHKYVHEYENYLYTIT